MKLTMLRFNLVAAFLATSALLAACGGGSSSAPSSTTTTSLTAQTITFVPAATGTVGTPMVLSASASSGLAVTFTSSPASVCTVSGTTLTLLAAGTCTVNANQAGNTSYSAATQVSRSITVSAAAAATTSLATFDEATPAVLDAFETAFSSVTDNGSKVAKLIKTTGNQPWGGATLKTCPANTDGFTPAIPFTSTIQTITVKVKAPRNGVVFSMKAEGTGAGAPTAGTFAEATSGGTGWETLTFNFANKTAGSALDTTKTYNKISIYPNWSESGAGNKLAETIDSTYLFDDFAVNGVVTLVACPPSSAPTVAADAPTVAAGNVLALYSDTYTPVVTGTFPTSWSSPTSATDLTFGANKARKFTSLDFAGLEPSVVQDISTYTHVNLSVWTKTGTVLKLKLVDFGANSVYQGGDDVEHEMTLTAPTQGQWTYYKIPLSSFTGLTTKAAFAQLIIATGGGAGLADYWIDDIYFSK